MTEEALSVKDLYSEGKHRIVRNGDGFEECEKMQPLGLRRVSPMYVGPSHLGWWIRYIPSSLVTSVRLSLSGGEISTPTSQD